MLKRVRDWAQVQADGHITASVVDGALAALGVDSLGLDDTDRHYLLAIIQKFGGGPVGLDTIAASISEESETVEDVYEPYLLQLGLLIVRHEGVLQLKAYEHLNCDIPQSFVILVFKDSILNLIKKNKVAFINYYVVPFS